MKKYSVTWPTRPEGVYTQLVYLVYADGPTDAVRVAAGLDWPTTDGYSMAFDYEPEVWQLRWPFRLRSHHVAGPDFGSTAANAVAFVPEPLDLAALAAEVVSVIRVCDARGSSKDEVRAAVGQIVGNLLPEQAEHVLVIVAAETKEINAYTGGWA
jgi:hypothetical protein